MKKLIQSKLPILLLCAMSTDLVRAFHFDPTTGDSTDTSHWYSTGDPVRDAQEHIDEQKQRSEETIARNLKKLPIDFNNRANVGSDWDVVDADTHEDTNAPTETKVKFQSTGTGNFGDGFKRTFKTGKDYVKEVIKQTLEGNSNAIKEFEDPKFLSKHLKDIDQETRKEILRELKKDAFIPENITARHNLDLIIKKLELPDEFQKEIPQSEKKVAADTVKPVDHAHEVSESKAKPTSDTTEKPAGKPTTTELEARQRKDDKDFRNIFSRLTKEITLLKDKTVMDTLLTKDGLLTETGKKLSNSASLDSFLKKADNLLVQANKVEFFEKFVSLAKSPKNATVLTEKLIEQAYLDVAKNRFDSEERAFVAKEKAEANQLEAKQKADNATPKSIITGPIPFDMSTDDEEPDNE